MLQSSPFSSYSLFEHQNLLLELTWCAARDAAEHARRPAQPPMRPRCMRAGGTASMRGSWTAGAHTESCRGVRRVRTVALMRAAERGSRQRGGAAAERCAARRGARAGGARRRVGAAGAAAAARPTLSVTHRLQLPTPPIKA